MKPIVTDTYDFPTLIRRGYVYVDKTALLHRLVTGVDGLMFFMSRPRRFGKLPLDVESFEVLPKRLDVCDLKKLPFDALMYQGGYLTIKEVKPSGSLVLGIPNRESAKGRADAVLKTAQSICIFEFKNGKTARQALRQIVAKGYAKPYAADNRPCAAYGVNYDPKNGEVVIAVDHMVSPKNRNSGPNKVPDKVPNKTTSVRVLELLRADPRATAEALGGELGIGDRAVRKIIAQHKAAGRLVRIGSRKSGHWQLKP